MLLSLAAAAVLSSAAESAPIASEQLPALFISACLDGNATAVSATAIEFSALPSGLRNRLGQPDKSQVWKLRSSGEAYLYSLSYFERNREPKICGIASEQLKLQPASAAVETRVRGTSSGGSYLPVEWLDERAGFRALATQSGGFTIMQINWLKDNQAEAQAPR